MSQYKKLCDGLQKLLIFVIAIFASVMIIITTVEVVRRYIFSESFQWAEELSRYLMVGVAFLGGAVAYRNKNLIPLDLVTNILPKKVQQILEFVLEIVTVIILALLFYLSTKAVMSPVVFRQTSIGLPISMAIPFSSMPVGFGCMLIFAAEHFVDIFNGFREEK
jgi:TRAP-type C4-dicarboxylate transport system permease small subunit